jgi:DnaJ-class molecular chaperone
MSKQMTEQERQDYDHELRRQAILANICPECMGVGIIDLAPNSVRLDTLRKCNSCDGNGTAQP